MAAPAPPAGTRGARRLSTGARQWLVYLVGFMPAIYTFILGVLNELGADPVKALEHALGLWALRFLILTLMITPLAETAGIRLIAYRRALGLLAFWYACLHLAAYLILDQQLALAAITGDIVRRPYITVGMAAFALLVPLAVTSNNLSIRRLGRRWRQLHRLIYGAAALAAAHFIMVVKSWPPEPLVYGGIVFLLLAYRLVPQKVRRDIYHRLAGQQISTVTRSPGAES